MTDVDIALSTVKPLIVAADFEAIRALENWLCAAVETLGLDHRSESVTKIHLAVHEVATNCVDHAADAEGDEIRFRAGRQPDRATLIIEISDTGTKTFTTSVARPSPEVPQVRGYGLMIADQVASSLSYQHVDDDQGWRNRWTLEFDDLDPSDAA